MLSKAIVTRGDGTFELTQVEIGEPINDEILVEIKASGICHTDYDSMKWGKTLVMGHEGAGIVKEIGSDVKNIKIGNKVILNWAIPCGSCFQCADGNQHICEENSFVTGNGSGEGHIGSTKLDGKAIGRSFNLGTMSQYTIVKSAAAVVVKDDIPFTSACIVGCGVMTGYGSVVNAAKVTPGSNCAVLGCGGVGLNVIQSCKIAGANKIIAIDISQERLDMAKSLGATDFILAKDIDFLEVVFKVKELTKRGADYAFECTSNPKLGDAPLALIRNAGVAVQASGIEQKIQFDCELFEWDKIYINPLYGQCKPQIDFPRIVDLYKSKRLKLDELVSKVYSIDHLSMAFDDMLNGRIAKGVISFE